MISTELLVSLVAVFGTLIEIFRQRGKQKTDNQKHLKDMQAQNIVHEHTMERAMQEQQARYMETMKEQIDKWSAQSNRQQLAYEGAMESNTRNLELYAQADTESKIYHGQVELLSRQIEKDRAALLEAMEKVGRYEALKERQERLEKAQAHVEKILSEAIEQNRKLTEENTYLKKERENLIGQISILQEETARIPILEREIQRLLWRIETLENQKRQIERGLEDDTFNAFPFVTTAVDSALGSDAGVGSDSKSGIAGEPEFEYFGAGTGDPRGDHLPVLAGDRLV